MPHNRFWPTALALPVLAIGGCGSEGECPDNYYKDGKRCRRIDAGALADAEVANPDAGGGTTMDGGNTSADALAPGPDASLDSAIATPSDASPAMDAAADASIGDAVSPDSSSANPDSGSSDASSAETCSPSPCQHGGSCTRTAQGVVCDCAETGYEGARCEIDIDECAKPNVCTNPEYPCAQTEAPGYTCQGLMADWPMPDAVLSANVRPSYDVDSEPGIVLDKITGLAWQRELPTVYDRCSGNINATGDSCTWEEAKSYCARLQLGGHDDWRLPSKIELESIADDTQPQAPSIDPKVFPNTPARYAWSRSSAQDAAYAWVGAYSASLTSPKTNTAAVRCTRTFRSPASGTPNHRYARTGNSSIYTDIADGRTGLVWRLETDAETYEFDGARNHCNGHGGTWRLPTKKELLTLVDTGRPNGSPQVDPIFGNTQLGFYRSISTFWDGIQLMSVDFATGSAFMKQNSERGFVRCVR